MKLNDEVEIIESNYFNLRLQPGQRGTVAEVFGNPIPNVIEVVVRGSEGPEDNGGWNFFSDEIKVIGST